MKMRESDIAKLHPLVQRFIKDREWNYVSPALTERAANTLQRLVETLEARGYGISRAAPPRGNANTDKAFKRTAFYIESEFDLFRVRIREVRGAGGEPIHWSKRRKDWTHESGREFIATGKLELTVEGRGISQSGLCVRDRRGTTAEDRIAALVETLDGVVAANVRRDLEHALRQRQIQREGENLRIVFVEEGNDAEIRRQVGQWLEAEEVRAYVEAGRAKATDTAEAEREQARLWWERCIEYANALDPLAARPGFPPSAPPDDGQLEAWARQGPYRAARYVSAQSS